MTDGAPELLSAPVSGTAVIEETYHLVSTGDELKGPLGFEMAASKHWSFEIINRVGPTPENPLVPMVRAADPQSRAETVILGVHLPREVHPADWLRVFVANKGHEVLDWRERPSKFGRSPDALVRGVGRTEGLIHRLTTIKDANRLFVIDSRMTGTEPLTQEPAYMTMANFKLLSPDGSPYAEPFRPLVLRAVKPVELLVSGLWYEIEGAVLPPEGGAVAVVENRLDDRLMATLVAVVGVPGGASAAELEEITLEKFRLNGAELTLGPDILSRYDSADGLMHLLARAWSGHRGAAMISVLSAQAQLDGVPVALSLLTPSPESQFEAWAIHRRAFDIAVNSLALG